MSTRWVCAMRLNAARRASTAARARRRTTQWLFAWTRASSLALPSPMTHAKVTRWKAGHGFGKRVPQLKRHLVHVPVRAARLVRPGLPARCEFRVHGWLRCTRREAAPSVESWACGSPPSAGGATPACSSARTRSCWPRIRCAESARSAAAPPSLDGKTPHHPRLVHRRTVLVRALAAGEQRHRPRPKARVARLPAAAQLASLL